MSFLKKLFIKTNKFDVFLDKLQGSNFQISGRTGCGKTSLMNHLASQNLVSSPDAAILKVTPATDLHPAHGFEINPWVVELQDETSMDLADYLIERPSGIAHLYYRYTLSIKNSFDAELTNFIKNLLIHEDYSSYLFLHLDEIDFLTTLQVRETLLKMAKPHYSMAVYSYNQEYERNSDIHTFLMFKQFTDNHELIDLLGFSKYFALKSLNKGEFSIFNKELHMNETFSLNDCKTT